MNKSFDVESQGGTHTTDVFSVKFPKNGRLSSIIKPSMAIVGGSVLEYTPFSGRTRRVNAFPSPSDGSFG